MRFMYPVSWPEYLFRVLMEHRGLADEAVHCANLIIATQRGRVLVWQ